MKTIKFLTLGCKVNQYDTQTIREQFIQLGLEEVKGNIPADVYLINTCTVTARSDADSLYLIRKSRRENQEAIIIATGCFTQLDDKKISANQRVDLIIKNKDKNSIAKVFSKKFLSYDFECEEKGISYFQGHTRAFVKIQDGCNNFCSYCRVPLARGRSKSRKVESVVREVERLVSNHFKEIVLCGVCLGSFGKDLKPQATLVNLINKLEEIRGLLRIRLSSIEAKDVTAGLIKKIIGSKKLCHHLHIPIQSGDDSILKKMNRRYTRKYYLNLIKKIRKVIPDIAITTDVLVGFPGETDENFKNTLELVKEIMPLKVHIFPYSPRPGTLAERKYKSLDQNLARKRIKYLKNTARICCRNFKNKFIGNNMEVLVEGPNLAKIKYLEGYTSNYLRVKIKSRNSLQNKLVKVKIREILGS